MNTFRHILLEKLPQLASQLSYGLLKGFGNEQKKIVSFSDLDMVIRKAEKQQWLQLAKEAEGLKHLQITDKGNVTHLFLYFEDSSFLQIDLLVELRRKSWVFMEVEEVLSNTFTNAQGWKVCSNLDSFEYVYWFYGLNGANVPEKYDKFFSELSANEKRLLAIRLSIPFQELKEALFSNLSKEKKTLQLFLSLKSENDFLLRAKRQWIDWGKKFNQRGLTISFSGVDGAGKSTMLELSKRLLEEKYRNRIVILRHRPSILPILSSFKYGKKGAEQRAAERLPRQGKNKNKVLSAIRFAYYFTDYLLGQFFIYTYYTLRGYTVLYDRYYFDFIVDARRSNIVFSPDWAKRLFAFVMKPDLNFLIYADPKTILARKQELSEQDIIQLTEGYKSLFSELDEKTPEKAFIALHNIEMNTSLDQIEQYYLTQVCHA